MLNKKKNNKGFTLVELLVVIAIIGILAVVAVPALFKNIEKGKVADLEADISAIRSASLSYYADHSSYPGPTLDEIEDEVESLGNPFGEDSSVYTLEGTAPGNLELVIKTTKEISANGIDKLEKDLGTAKIHKDNTDGNCNNQESTPAPEPATEVHVIILEGDAE